MQYAGTIIMGEERSQNTRDLGIHLVNKQWYTRENRQSYLFPREQTFSRLQMSCYFRLESLEKHFEHRGRHWHWQEISNSTQKLNEKTFTKFGFWSQNYQLSLANLMVSQKWWADLNVAFVVVAIRILLLEEKEQFVKDDELSVSLCPHLAHMDLTLALGNEVNIIYIRTWLNNLVTR